MYHLRVSYYDNVKNRCVSLFESDVESEEYAKKAVDLLAQGFNYLNGTRIYADLFFNGEFVKEL